MLKSKYRIVGSLAVSLLLVIVFSLSAAQNAPSFRIGILDNERGPIALAAGTAIQTINASGGVLGADGTVFQLEAVVVPPDADGNIQSSLNNLAQANVIAILGPLD
ncbi:MAG TPA: hypothetical protein VHL11_12485, partial [Phototrophicaceae bacterium]|nr:hypothetical protein [Phototrophicaceae bacterium]